jgi:hypothetical protein
MSEFVHTGDAVILKVRYDSPELGDATALLKADHNMAQYACTVVARKPDAPMPDLRECVFVITPKLNCNAKKEFQRVRKKEEAQRAAGLHRTRSAEQQKNVDEALKNAEQRAKNEDLQNREKRGQKDRLYYGTPVQLLHRMTGLFLTSKPEKSGKVFPKGVRLGLSDGTMHSVFTIKPFYKHKVVGEAVLQAEQIVFESAVLKEAIYYDAKPSPKGTFINASQHTDTQMMEVCVFQKAIDPVGFFTSVVQEAQSPYLHYLQMVYLYGCHRNGFFGASSHQGQHDPSRNKGLKPPYSKVVSASFDDKDNFRSKSMWTFVISKDKRQHLIDGKHPGAGRIMYETECYIQHVGSGLFLAVDDSVMVSGEYGACLVREPGPHSVFHLLRIEGTEDFVVQARPKVLIKFPGFEDTSSGNGKKNVPSRSLPPLFLTTGPQKKRPDGTSKPTEVLVFSKQNRIRNAVMIGLIKDHDRLTVNESMKILEALKRNELAVDELNKEPAALPPPGGQPAESSTDQKIQKEDDQRRYDECFESIEATLAWLIFWIAKPPAESTAPLENTGAVDVKRQLITREVGIITHLLGDGKDRKGLLQTMEDKGYKVKNMTSRATVDLSGAPKPKKDTPRHVTCLKLILKAVYFCFLGSRNNEDYIAKLGGLERINNLNGLGLGAADVFKALVGDNQNILRKFKPEVIEKFVNFIRRLGPDDTWLRFLQGVCSTDGVAVSRNQQFVLRMAFSPGPRAPMSEVAKWGDNRKNLFMKVTRLQTVVGGIDAPETISRSSDELAYKVVTGGINEIGVAWESMASWAMDCGALYHAPQALGLEVQNVKGVSWVTLSSIAWTLEPETFYPIVFPGSGQSYKTALKNASGEQQAQWAACKVIANFFVNQLYLIAEMCRDRQINCILTLQKEYNLELCLCGLATDRLPWDIRNGFAYILGNMWIDRHPQRFMTLPSMVRDLDTMYVAPTLPVFEPHDLTPDGPDFPEFYSIAKPEKFAVVLSVVKSILKNQGEFVCHARESRNRCVGTCGKLMTYLLQCGFVSTVPQLSEILTILINLLDGTTDWITEPKAADASESLPLQNGTSFHVSESAFDGGSAADAKRPLLESVGSVMATCAGNSATTESELSFLYPPCVDGPERYLANPKNRVVAEAKREFANGVAAAAGLMMHLKCSQMMTLYVKRGHSIDEILPNVIKMLQDQSTSCTSHGLTMVELLDLLMYDDSALFTVILELIDMQMTWTDRATRLLVDMRVFAGIGDIALQAKRDVARLGNLLQSHETWGMADSFNDLDLGRVDECIQLCTRLRQMCTVGEGDTDTPDKGNQALLIDLRLIPELLYAYQLDLDSVKESIVDPKDTRAIDAFKKTMKAVNDLAAMLTSRCPKAQESFFSNLAILRKWFNLGVGVSNALTNTFAGNRALCERVSDDLIIQYESEIKKGVMKGEYKPHQLSFLLAIVAVGGRSIMKNKRFVVGILNKVQSDGGTGIMHLLTNKASERLEMIQKFGSSKEFHKNEIFRSWKSPKDAEFVYHLKCLHLLGMLAIGRDTGGAEHYVRSCVDFREAMDALKVSLDIAFGDIVTREPISPKASSNAKPGITATSADAKYIATEHVIAVMLLVGEAHYDTDTLDIPALLGIRHQVVLDKIGLVVGGLVRDMVQNDCSELHQRAMAQILDTMSKFMEGVALTVGSKYPLILRKDTAEVLLDALTQSHWEKLPSELQESAGRLIRFIDLDRQARERIPAPNRHREPVGSETGMSNVTSALDDIQKEYNIFSSALRAHPSVQKMIDEEHLSFLDTLLNLGSLTDPTDAKYMKNKALYTFRRNQLHVEDICKRIIQHGLENLEDQECVKRIFRILIHLLEYIVKLVDDKKLSEEYQSRFQSSLASVGAVDFVIAVLMMRPTGEVSILAMTTGIRLLEPNNVDVQQTFEDIFYSIDDTGLWAVIFDTYGSVIESVAYARQLKARRRESGPESLSKEEANFLLIYEADLSNVTCAMRLQQVLCEGHRDKMQNYIFQQVDNGTSFPLVDTTADLVLKLASDQLDELGDDDGEGEKANPVEELDAEEAEVLEQALELLIEVMQGPCTRNQVHLSVCGLVEATMKVLKSDFKTLCAQAVEDGQPPEEAVYPRTVRNLKAKFVKLLDGMLEAQKENQVHMNVMYRLHKDVLKWRLVFVHQYFLQKEGYGTVNLKTLDGPEQHIRVRGVDPKLLCEELTLKKLDDLFSEAINILIVVNQVIEFSDELKALVEFKPPSENEPKRAAYLDDEAFNAATIEWLQQHKYADAYAFFSRWVNNIEVCIDGKIFEIFFRMPVLCDYVLGRTKTEINNSVTTESPEDKMKDFISQCQEAYAQTKHTRELSKLFLPELFIPKWMLRGAVPTVPQYIFYCVPVPSALRRPCNFLLKEDSKYLMLIAEWTLNLAYVINALLLLGPLSRPVTKGGDPVIADAQVEVILYYVGLIYLIPMLISLWMQVQLIAPLEYTNQMSIAVKEQQREDVENAPSRAKVVFVLIPVAACAILSLFVSYAAAAGALVGGLLALDGLWGDPAPDWISVSMRTMSLTLGTEDVMRRLVWSISCYLGLAGNYWGYGFLLLEIVFQKEELRNVIKAIVIPARPLMLTFIVGMEIMYIYALVAFYRFREDYDGSCQEFKDCIVTTVYQGFRQDIGSAISPVAPGDTRWYPRVAFDLSYFLIITTVLMNVIFGIILDTFGALRDETQERGEYMRQNTFISTIPRQDIDKCAQKMNVNNGNGYSYLEEKKQDRWKYLNFLFYLETKDHTEFSGIETYIFNKLEDEDVTWLPLRTCRVMEQFDAKNESKGE